MIAFVAVLEKIFSILFGSSSIMDLLKTATRYTFIMGLIAVITTFSHLLLTHIPNLSVGGCVGEYLFKFGLIDGLRLMLSIVYYGYLFKITTSLISKTFD